jgi:hypothetical protein
MESKSGLPLKDIQNVSREKLSSDKVSGVVDFLEKALNIPKERIEVVRNTPVYLVGKDIFFDEISKHAKQLGFKIPEEYVLDESKRESAEVVANIFGTTVEKIKNKRTKLLEDFYKEYSMTRGVSICSKDGEKVILINRDEVSEVDRDEVLSHELIHSMVDTPEEGSGFNAKTGFGHNLNEAAVQLMNLRAKYNEMGWEDFSRGIFDGSIKSVSYRKEMGALLVLMKATSFGNEEYTFERLKGDYFGEGEAGEKAFFVKISLIRAIPDKIGEKTGMKNEMQKLFESRLERSM